MSTSSAAFLLLPNPRTPLLSPSPKSPPPPIRIRVSRVPRSRTLATGAGGGGGGGSSKMTSPAPPTTVDCVGTGSDVECAAASSEADRLLEEKAPAGFEIEGGGVSAAEGSGEEGLIQKVLEWGLLVSPFFFWGSAMVAMKEVIPKSGPFFVSAFRLIPAGALLIGFAATRGRKQPSGLLAWASILAFGVVDAACFQGFLAEGLQRTSAGLGSRYYLENQLVQLEQLGLCWVSLVFFSLRLFLIGLKCSPLIKVPAISFDGSTSSIWGSGEWWMLLAAQSMAVGTIMVRWVCKYSDPVMATGWHMIIGGLPLVAISILNHDPAVNGNLMELSSSDLLALCYTSVFGSAVSYGVYFYNATKGSLTKLSSLTFLTPMFASIFGFLYLGETFSPIQLGGALITLLAIYMVNYRSLSDKSMRK